MNKALVGLAIAAALSCASPAVAQQKAAPTAGQASNVEIPRGVFYKGQQANQYLAKDMLLGAKVRNSTGQIIGDIEDFILTENNEIEGVIMGTGGFLGAREKKIGVRLSALKITEQGGKTVVTLPEATKEVLAALQPYKRAKPPRSLLDRAMEKAQELADKTAETSKDAYQTAKEKAGPAIERAKEATKSAYDKAMDAAKPAQPSEQPKQQ